MGAYLRDHPPARDQFRSPRRARPTGLICVHTAENVLDTVGPDTGAENVARWMTQRTTPGSYHDLVDSDSTVQVVDYGDEAYHDGTGSNPFSLSISFALAAKDWPALSPNRRAGFLRQGATAFARQQTWLRTNRYPVTPVVRVSRAQSNQGAPGFISHGERDPGRRTDPGVLFPWGEFFNACRSAVGTNPTGEDDDMPYTETDLKRIIAETLRENVGDIATADEGSWWRAGMVPLIRDGSVQGATAALRSEGVSGAGDLGRTLSALAPLLSDLDSGLSEEDVQRVAAAVTRLDVQEIADSLRISPRAQ